MQEKKEADTLSACRILVAEDNPVNQQIVLRMLQSAGCNADMASNGHEAVLMHGMHPYDLLLMDCQMPQLDGYEATARIRGAEQPPRRTPIIALTADGSQAQRDKCIAAGMDDFLSKPLQPQILKQMLERWLRPVAQSASGVPGHNDRLDEVHAAFGADFAELATLFQRDSAQRLAKLQLAKAAGDGLQIARIAHAFSGSCASMGAGGLSALCKELELLAMSGALKDCEKKLAAIDTEYQRIILKLQTISDLRDCFSR